MFDLSHANAVAAVKLAHFVRKMYWKIGYLTEQQGSKIQTEASADVIRPIAAK